MFSVSVWVLYLLTIVFLILSLFFLTGKGSGLFVSRDAIKGGRFDSVKMSKALGICFMIMTLLLSAASLFREYLPEWYSCLFTAGAALALFSSLIICNANIIFK